MLSIIIPAYKSYNYIEECLDSVQNQSYLKDNNISYEILVGVDGCEKTLNKLLEIRHKYNNLKIVNMLINKGLFITINTLQHVSKHDIILKFDSDDIMLPNLIENTIKYIDNYDIIKFSYIFFENDIKNVIKKRVYYAGGVYLMKKSVLDISGGYRPWLCSGDEEFITRVKNHVKIKHLDEELFYRRKHDNSLTQNKKTGYDSDIRKKYKKMVRTYDKSDDIYIKSVINEFILL